MQDLLTLDPDGPEVRSCAPVISRIIDQYMAPDEVLITPITEGSTGWFNLKDRYLACTAYGVTGVSSTTSVDLKHQPVPTRFTNIKDSPVININFESGLLKIKNKYGYSKPIEFGFFGIGLA